jgi:hypothetical protein
MQQAALPGLPGAPRFAANYPRNTNRKKRDGA